MVEKMYLCVGELSILYLTLCFKLLLLFFLLLRCSLHTRLKPIFLKCICNHIMYFSLRWINKFKNNLSMECLFLSTLNIIIFFLFVCLFIMIVFLFAFIKSYISIHIL